MRSIHFLFRTKRRKLDTLILIFIVLMNIVRILNIGLYFSAVGQVLTWNFLMMHLHWNVCNWNAKLIRAGMALFWNFFGWLFFVSSSSSLHGLKFLRIAQFVFLFSRHEVFSISSLRVTLEIHKPKLRKPKITKVPKQPKSQNNPARRQNC